MTWPQISSVTSTSMPLQAELLVPLDVTHLHVGSPVPARVEAAWKGTECSLAPGQIVAGTVMSLARRGKGMRDSNVVLSFHLSSCTGKADAFVSLTLFALIAQPGLSPGATPSGLVEAQPLADALGNAIGGGVGGGHGGGLRSASGAAAINSSFSLPVHTFPAHVKPGEVLGLHKVVLGMGEGNDKTTRVTGLGNDLRLEAGTSLVLIETPVGMGTELAKANSNPGSSGSSRGFHMTGTGGGGSELVPSGASVVTRSASSAPVAASPPLQPADTTEVCSADCTAVGAGAAEAVMPRVDAVARLRLTALGYSPRERKEMSTFGDETTLMYLDAENLLVTFDPHHLRERSAGAREVWRTVRVALIDPRSHSVKRAVDWRVQGEDPYVWAMPGGRVLVHLGGQLKLLDAQLHEMRSTSVEGRVAWIAVSPSGDRLAIGTVRERHTEAVHRDLESALSQEPEEDVLVHVLGAGFNEVGTAEQSSKASPPVLSDEGELRLNGDGHTHWRLTELQWDHTERGIGLLRSACRPSLSMSGSSMVFAVGCRTNGGRWYRMLRMDGHSLLKAESLPDEIEQAATGVCGGVFAVRSVKTTKTQSYGQPFLRKDLLEEEFGIYRVQDGKPLSTVHNTDLGFAEKAFALSPSGDQLAVAGRQAILFFTIDAPHP